MPKVQITMPASTRATMNSKTPRPKDWTFHHVLPVRYWYAMAYVLCHAYARRKAATPAEPTDAIASALKALCWDKQNKGKVPGLLTALATTTDNANVNALAKLCASPIFGGFSGVIPDQRCDDPKEQVEKNRPASGLAEWWSDLMMLSPHVTRLSLSATTNSGTKMEVDLEESEFDDLVDKIVVLINHLGSNFGGEVLGFTPGDWQYSPTASSAAGVPWTYSGKILKPAATVVSNALPRFRVKPLDDATGGGKADDIPATANDKRFRRLRDEKDRLGPDSLEVL